MPWTSFSCLIVSARKASTIVNRSGKNTHPCFVLGLRGGKQGLEVKSVVQSDFITPLLLESTFLIKRMIGTFILEVYHWIVYFKNIKNRDLGCGSIGEYTCLTYWMSCIWSPGLCGPLALPEGALVVPKNHLKWLSLHCSWENWHMFKPIL